MGRLVPAMAKPKTDKIKLLSSAGTGYFYVTKKNPRTATDCRTDMGVASFVPDSRIRFTRICRM